MLERGWGRGQEVRSRYINNITIQPKTTMNAEDYPFVKELITDTEGTIRKVVIDFSDYQRLVEAIEDEGLVRAMMEVKEETPLNLDEALAELEKVKGI